MKKTSLIAFISLLSLTSCANIFNNIVFPNSCKQCEVINRVNNEVLFSNKGCGGDNTKLEEEAKIRAYDLSYESYNLCDLEVVCEEWTKEKDAEE